MSNLVNIVCTFGVITRRRNSTCQLTLGLHVRENGHELNEMWPSFSFPLTLTFDSSIFYGSDGMKSKTEFMVFLNIPFIPIAPEEVLSDSISLAQSKYRLKSLPNASPSRRYRRLEWQLTITKPGQLR